MILPKAVKIGLHTYTLDEPVSIERKDGSFLYGHIGYDEQTIDVVSALHPDMKLVTLLHEIIHGVLFQSGQFLDNTDEERVCVALSHGLLQVLRDNPELRELLK